MSAPPLKVTISRPAEFPDRKLPYVVRWRLNGRGHWRSFATKRGKNGADAFCALLNVAAMNERDWDLESGVPASMSAPDAPSRSAGILASWLTPSPKELLDDGTVEWVWSSESLPRNIQSWIDKNSPLLADLNREVLYETDKWMRLRPDGVTSYAPNTQNRLVTVAKTALSVAVKRGLIENVPWPRRESGATDFAWVAVGDTSSKRNKCCELSSKRWRVLRTSSSVTARP
jgi:hypothetical protein